MNPEDKELLIKDLCVRLPYGVKIEEDGYFGGKLVSIEKFNINGIDMSLINGSDLSKHIIKPYLFPISAMTGEQREQLYNVDNNGNIYFKIQKEYNTNINVQIDIKDVIRYADWLNKNHFDYRGLIDKGLAIDCTNLGIY